LALASSKAIRGDRTEAAAPYRPGLGRSFRLSAESRHRYNAALSKHAALRLARYFRALGHRVKIRRHWSPAGAFYSLEFLAPKKRATWRGEPHFASMAAISKSLARMSKSWDGAKTTKNCERVG